MKRLLSLDKLTEKQRLLVLLMIGTLVAMIIVIGIRTPQKVKVTTVIPSKSVNQPVSIPVKPPKATGKQIVPAESAFRDPFALPPEFSGQKKTTAPVSPEKATVIASPEKSTSNSPKENFRFTGIIAAGDKRLAVISSANKSKAYQIDELIGRYKLSAINDESITLTGNDQTLVLRLESPQKRGTAIEK